MFTALHNFLVTADGGLTPAGYLLCLAIVLLCLIAVGFFHTNTQNKRLSTKQLTWCAAALALAFLSSYIKFFDLPFGGSVTFFSMLFICLIGYWFGLKVGLITGLAYGILQFLQGPYVLSFFQVCCDYFFAFAALGLSGVFSKSKNGLIKGYLLGILMRGFFHSLGGYLYWMDYMPENFPQSLTAIYPIVYNYSYILAEGIVTLVVISLPPVKKALVQLKKNAIA
ncbi:MAG: energy-coupled thiamine transporter ThiT [bacterium]|nr:energy-coupled thiamine transporter ThiT [bacterium]